MVVADNVLKPGVEWANMNCSVYSYEEVILPGYLVIYRFLCVQVHVFAYTNNIHICSMYTYTY